MTSPIPLGKGFQGNLSQVPHLLWTIKILMIIRDSQRNDIEDFSGYLVGNQSVSPGLPEGSSILSVDLPDKNTNLQSTVVSRLTSALYNDEIA